MGTHGVQSLYSVGCSAELIGVHPHQDGTIDIMTRGARRFRIRRMHPPVADRPDWADVEFPDDSPSPDSAGLASSASQLFGRYRRAVLAAQGIDDDGEFTMPADPVSCSYVIAAAMVLDLTDRQRLLEAATVDDRLTLATVLLRREIAMVGQLSTRAGAELPQAPYSPN